MLQGKIQVRKFPAENLVIFAFEGDFADPSYIADTIKPLMSDYKNIVLDVNKVDYINSSAFGSFFDVASKVDRNKSAICFMNPNKKFRIVADSLGATKIFNIITSLNEL